MLRERRLKIEITPVHDIRAGNSIAAMGSRSADRMPRPIAVATARPVHPPVVVPNRDPHES
jgi:hypothetical protein